MSKNTNALILLTVGLVVVLLFTSGLLAIQLPTAQDKYTEVVNRNALDIGMKIPIEVRLNFDQTTDTNQANIDVTVRHKHDTTDSYGTSGDYVPDPELVTRTDFDTEVGNVGDTTTIFAVNGNTFIASDIAYNGSLLSQASVDFGYAQDNIKVWTTDTMVVPDTIALGKSNHVIVVQVVFDKLVKGTDTVLNSYAVTWGIYYLLPDYNDEDAYEDPFTFWVYLPFDDYALAQDIRMTVRGYSDSCAVSWKSITSTIREAWSVNLFGITVFEVIKQRDTVVETNLQYVWRGPRAYDTDNTANWGSHSYKYKVR